MWRGIPSFVGIEATSTASIQLSAMRDVQVRNFQISKSQLFIQIQSLHQPQQFQKKYQSEKVSLELVQVDEGSGR